MGVQYPPAPHLLWQVLKQGRVWARACGSPSVSGRHWDTEFHSRDAPGAWDRGKKIKAPAVDRNPREGKSQLCLPYSFTSCLSRVWIMIKSLGFCLPSHQFDFSSQTRYKHTWKDNTHVSHGGPCTLSTKTQHYIKVGLSLTKKFSGSLFDSTRYF